VITAYTIVYGALVIGGRTGDRFGRRRVLLSATAVFVVGSLLCGAAPSLEFLVGARVVQGIGAAFLVPPSVALLIAAYPAHRRTQVVALWGGVGALAVATGPTAPSTPWSARGWVACICCRLGTGRSWCARTPPGSAGSACRQPFLAIVCLPSVDLEVWAIHLASTTQTTTAIAPTTDEAQPDAST